MIYFTGEYVKLDFECHDTHLICIMIVGCRCIFAWVKPMC